MRSETCRFQKIFKYRNTELLLLFSIITTSFEEEYMRKRLRQIGTEYTPAKINILLTSFTLKSYPWQYEVMLISTKPPVTQAT